MPTSSRPTAFFRRVATLPRWALALLTAAIAVTLRAGLQPMLGDTMPFLIAYPAVVLAASQWGVAAGVIVALVSVIVAIVPEVPPTIASGDRPLHVGAFLLAAIFICLVSNLRSRAAPVQASDGAQAFDTPLETWLRAVLWGSLLVPFTAFVAASWWGYEHAVGEARMAAERAAVLVRDQAQRTIEIAERIARRANDAAAGADADVRAREADVHARLADMVAGLTSVVNLNVWDAQGRALARSDRYPTDHVVAVPDRAYFLQQKNAPVPLGISEVLRGRQTGQELLNATIRRATPDGQFGGVVSVSLSPAYFADYYRSLAADNPTLARFALVRTDGAILAAWPQRQRADDDKVAPDDAVLARVRSGARDGHLEATSHRDGERRFVSFQRVGDYPLYVVAGVSRAAMLAGWLRFVGLLAALLVPVTGGLAYVSLVALRKTRREQAITAALNDALRRRAAAEKAMLESQKLETLAQLTGGVAHDFNNLLAIVSSSLHVHSHLHPELGEERHMQAMSRAVQSGTRLTRQLLSFSRKQALRPETIALQTWLPGAEGLLRSTLGSRIAMEVAVEADVRPIQVDVGELELALINLSLNAKHAMPGGGLLRITARNELASEGSAPMVVISVADSGVGIAPDVLARVFEPFFTTRMNEAGSGLGLSQVHGFCAQAGGRARIASEPGVGTTVEMVLPAESSPGQAVPTEDAAGPQALAGSVLLVEDNEDVALSTAAILQAAGLVVTHHWSADTALAALRGGARLPDIVLSDIEMPGKLSGMDLAFRLRELWPALPVVLITGYAKQLEDAVSGGLRVLPKPTPPQDLLRELERALYPPR
jgi:two-component system NtrC family sensor kinase